MQSAQVTEEPETLDEFGLRRVLVVLCVTEIISWGVLYYAFPVLAPSIAADTGWTVAEVTAAFSTGLVVSALLGIPAGRWLDRAGPRPVMTLGSVLAVPAVAGIATASTLPRFFAAWVLAGVAMAGTLYPPAFAALTRWWGPRRITALTAVTLLAGLASTIFAPLTATLLGHLQWRRSYLVLAVVLAVVTIPAHLLGLRGRWPDPQPGDRPAHVDHAPDAIVRSRAFLLLVAAVALGAFTAFAVVVNQVPLLIERGLSTSVAAWALGLGGLGQVAGRLGYGRLTRATSVRTRSVAVLALAAVGHSTAGGSSGADRAADRRGDARRCRPWRVHAAPGHRRQRPLGCRPLRPAQRTALRPRPRRHGTRSLGGRRPRPQPRQLPRGLLGSRRDRSTGRSPRHRFHTGSETERALTSAHRRRRIHPMSTPSVLFVCVRNGGKSQMAAGLMRKAAGDRVAVHSAGTNPGTSINALSAEVLAELGAEMDSDTPRPVDPELLRTVDLVVTLGREAVLEVPAGVELRNWDTDEPSTRGIDGIERMRLIRDDIDTRVHALLAELVL